MMSIKIKTWILNCIYTFLWSLPGKKYIIFESNPDFSDNTGTLFEKVLENGWEKRYHLVWFCDSSMRPYISGVRYVSRTSNGIARIRRIVIGARAAAIIYCNKILFKRNSKTLQVFLSHGSVMKRMKGYYNIPHNTDYMLSLSEYWNPVTSEQLEFPEERLVIMGFPRNDDLFDHSVNPADLFSGYRFEKLVIWLPTYRHHKLGSQILDVPAIPVIHDRRAVEKINALARKENILIVVKPHPAQDVDCIRKMRLSNFTFIQDSFLYEHGIRAYQLLAVSDALITDYSSVSIDYLLTGKPIGLTFEDFNIYKDNPGFAIDTSLITNCSYMLDTVEDFSDFFHVIMSGEDRMQENRYEVMCLTNQYRDANSSQRVLNFIEEKLRERDLWSEY